MFLFDVLSVAVFVTRDRFVKEVEVLLSLGRTAQDVHLDSHTAPELWSPTFQNAFLYAQYIRELISARKT